MTDHSPPIELAVPYLILNDFRIGKLGSIALEFPPEAPDQTISEPIDESINEPIDLEADSLIEDSIESELVEIEM